MCPSACLPCLFLAPGAQFSCDALAAGRTKRPQCLPDVGWEQGIQHRCQNHPGEEMKAASATQTPRGLQEELGAGLGAKDPKKSEQTGLWSAHPCAGGTAGQPECRVECETPPLRQRTPSGREQDSFS